MKIVVIQGPNLNMLGVRERELYGAMTLADIHAQMEIVAKDSNIEIEFFQSNLEGEIVDRLQECLGTVDGIIINPGAYTHTSIAIRDAVSAIQIPTVEVHVSNIYAREEFRHKSLIAPIAQGQISGFGPFGYHLAMLSIIQIMNEVQRYKDQINQQQAEQSNSNTPEVQPQEQPTPQTEIASINETPNLGNENVGGGLKLDSENDLNQYQSLDDSLIDPNKK
jgi:3-dehydroquinate dehydratase-2